IYFFCFQAEDGIRDDLVTGVQTCALPILHFSPDGAHVSFLNTKDNGIELWVAEVASGKAKMISGADRLNSTTGDPCDWLHDNMKIGRASCRERMTIGMVTD